jgi:hypothetical protein
VTQALAWVDGGEGNVMTLTCTAIDNPDAFDEFERVLSSVRPLSRESMVVPSSPSRRQVSPSTPPPMSDETPMYSTVPMPGARPFRR